ncbi:HAD family hydrolase [Kiritimatiellota bacterium B12222]|nr:HAD family hydrolase [Kiritimatiellota bacterium B12222]
MEALFTDRIQRLSKALQIQATDQPAKLIDLQGVEAVIFDIYGTCFLSGSGDIGTVAENPKVGALIEALREQGVALSPELADEALARFYELIALDHEQEKVKGTQYPEIRILDIWEQWRREAAVNVNVQQLAIDVECRLNPVWPMPGVDSCLQGLQQMGLTLGVVSNAQVFTPCLFPALLGKKMEDYGFSPQHCVWSWTLKEAKPSVRLYEGLLSRLDGIAPEKCLYVGNDMLNDITPASQVGMKTALFAGDRRSLRLREGDERVAGVVPDIVITRLTQLLECV